MVPWALGRAWYCYQECGGTRKGIRPTEHDIASTDEKDIKGIISMNKGCPVHERLDRGSSTTTRHREGAHLSIRINLVGSMELLRDAVLDDPRLGMEVSPPRGVMWNEKDMVDELRGVRGKRPSCRLERESRVGRWGRKKEGGDLEVRFSGRPLLIKLEGGMVISGLGRHKPKSLPLH